MLIKKYTDNENNKEHSLYNSSNVLASEYNKDTNDLKVIFQNGGHYIYKNVDNTDHARFQLAESQGKVLNQSIKPTYEYIKKDDVDVEDYKKNIEDLIKKEVEQMEKELKELMDDATEDYETNGNFSRRTLNSITTVIKNIKDHEQNG